jgi:branched-chain amino acid transport system permease protein
VNKPTPLMAWIILFLVITIYPVVSGSNPMLVASSIFSIWAAVNLMWVLVWGTAGLFSLATMAVVGTASYGVAYLSINYGLAWYFMLPLGIIFGLVIGMIIGLPVLRVKGVYYSLLTMGITEFLRVYVSQNKALGSSASGLYGADSFVPEALLNTRAGFTIIHFVALIVLLLALLVHYRVDHGRLGLLLRTARESESTALAFGVNVPRTRMMVFIISSMALGFIGAFYVTVFRSISASIFSLETLLLLLAMMVIGGMNSRFGIVLGTALVVFVDQQLTHLGPNRMIGIAVAMLLITLFAENGLVSVPTQIRRWLKKRQTPVGT